MKKYNILFSTTFILLCCINLASAQEVPLLLPKAATPSPVQVSPKTEVAKPSSQPVANNSEFANGSKTYTLSAENLFLLTLASLSFNNYKINEICSKNGYIIFNTNNKEFLATIAKANNQISTIKITPTNNSYAFPQSTVDKVFNYINNNIK